MNTRLLAGIYVLSICLTALADVRQGPRLLKPAEAGVGRLIPDLTFTDLKGKAGRLSDFKSRAALVIAFTSTSCPLTRKFAPELARLESDFAKRGVAFLFVNPTSDSVEDQITAARDHGFLGPVVRDTRGELARALGAQTTTDTFVLDGARTLLYRGAVSDQYGLGFAHDAPRQSYLRDALEAVLAGRSVAMKATWAPGCELDLKPARVAVNDVTYHNRVSRILQSNCLECHRAGGIAPFSLETYADVAGRAGMIKKVVGENLMPPWFAAPAPAGTHTPWRNDRSLAAADKTDLLAWLNGGRSEGNPADAPLPLKLAAGWQIGEPDAVVQLPRPVEVKATGKMPYVNLFVKTDFAEDRWVTALEIRPTAPEVVHHVLVFVIPASEAENLRGRDLSREDRGYFAGYVPGTSYATYPAGFAKLLPAGATLHFQLHYTPAGTATRDQTRLGLRFAPQPPENVVRVAGISNHRLAIPPREPNYAATAAIPVPADVMLLGYMPHMHVRGKAFRYDLLPPGGKRETLLDVPRYDFNWQLRYEHAEPRPVVAGSRIEITGWFDNSAGNPANPDPDKTVKWGPQTEDEMLLGYVEYYIPGLGTAEPDRGIRTAAGTGRGTDLRQRFRELDKNRDGRITPDELPQPLLFGQLDANRDGEITEAEAGAQVSALTRKMTEAMAKTEAGSQFLRRLFENLDSNNDGRLTVEEIPPQMQDRVKKADRDGDGVLTRRELEQALGGRK